MATDEAPDEDDRGNAVDFKEQLRRQLSFLETSCREYDAGNREEAIRLSMPLRVIFHQTTSSTSLMTHLRAGFIRLLSTATKRPRDQPGVNWFPLVRFELDPQASIFRCNPKLDLEKAGHRQRLFADWWRGEAIYMFGHKKVRRRDLVLAAANKVGGGHVDPDMPTDYRWMVDGVGWKVNLRPDNGPEREIALYGAHLAALRQVAHEVLKSRELTKLAS